MLRGGNLLYDFHLIRCEVTLVRKEEVDTVDLKTEETVK